MEADADDTQIVVRGAAIVGGVSIGITLGCTLLPGYDLAAEQLQDRRRCHNLEAEYSPK